MAGFSFSMAAMTSRGIEDFTPGFFDGADLRAVAGCNVLHANAKDALDANQNHIAGFDQVCEERFHAR